MSSSITEFFFMKIYSIDGGIRTMCHWRWSAFTVDDSQELTVFNKISLSELFDTVVLATLQALSLVGMITARFKTAKIILYIFRIHNTENTTLCNILYKPKRNIFDLRIWEEVFLFLYSEVCRAMETLRSWNQRRRYFLAACLVVSRRRQNENLFHSSRVFADSTSRYRLELLKTRT